MVIGNTRGSDSVHKTTPVSGVNTIFPFDPLLETRTVVPVVFLSDGGTRNIISSPDADAAITSTKPPRNIVIIGDEKPTDCIVTVPDGSVEKSGRGGIGILHAFGTDGVGFGCSVVVFCCLFLLDDNNITNQAITIINKKTPMPAPNNEAVDGIVLC